MESAHISSEYEPLYIDVAETNNPEQILEADLLDEHTIIDFSCIFDEQAPLHGSRIISNEQARLDESDAFSDTGASACLDTRQPITSSPTPSEEKLIEVSLEEVVQALYSAWQRNRQPEYEFKSEFFSEKDIYAMHVAWKNVTLGKHCSSRAHIIAEALAAAIAKDLIPGPENDEHDKTIEFDREFNLMKNLLTAHLLEEWFRIHVGDDSLYEESYYYIMRYVVTVAVEDPSEQQHASSEYWRRQVELYDKAHDFFLNPKLQILLHTLLFFWPLYILSIGSKYMECLIGHHLSHLLMTVGCLGCLAILFRLVLMILTAGSDYPSKYFWKWRYMKLVEFSFLIAFIVQAVHFFDINPTTEPDPDQCEKNFYNAALMLNYVSIPLLSVYLFIYFVVFCANQFNFWHWLVTNF